MYLLKSCVLIWCLFLLVSCEKDAAEYPVISSMKEPPVITGIAMKDEKGGAIGWIGSPNVNTGTSPRGFKILAYPNPCKNNLNLAISALTSGSARVWMAGAKFEGAASNLSIQFLYDSNTTIDIRYVSLKSGLNNIAIDISARPEGYYRLYVEMEGTTYWDNIWVDKN